MSPEPSTPPRRSPASLRAEEFLRRVLPGPARDDDPVPSPGGVDDRTQALLEAMGHDDRESW